MTSQFPQKVSIQITLHQWLQKESKKKQRLILLYKRVSFQDKNTSSFTFFSSPFIFGLESGKIYANFSGEIVTSSSVLGHWDIRNIRPQIIWPPANFRPQIAHLGPRNFRPQIISPTPNKHTSTTVPKVKELPLGFPYNRSTITR